jgi:hypothetical protein
MGCDVSKTTDDHDFSSRVPLFDVVNLDSIDNIFLDRGKILINEIDDYRRVLYENMLDLMIYSGACCFIKQVPRFEDCLTGLFYKIATDSQGDIMSTNLKFDEEVKKFEVDASLISEDSKQLIKIINTYVKLLFKRDMDKNKLLDDLEQIEKDVKYEYKFFREKENKPVNKNYKEIFKKIEVNLKYIDKLKIFVCEIDETINSYITMARDTELRINQFKHLFDEVGYKAYQANLKKPYEIYWNGCKSKSNFGKNPEAGLIKWIDIKKQLVRGP